jgi:hypothetical protein
LDNAALGKACLEEKVITFLGLPRATVHSAITSVSIHVSSMCRTLIDTKSEVDAKCVVEQTKESSF